MNKNKDTTPPEYEEFLRLLSVARSCWPIQTGIVVASYVLGVALLVLYAVRLF